MTTFDKAEFTTEAELQARLTQLCAQECKLGGWAQSNGYEREYNIPYGSAYVRGLHLTTAHYD